MFKRKWHTHLQISILSLLLCSPSFVWSGGYDDLAGGGSSSDSHSGSTGSSGKSNGSGGAGTDINDYASNNGQIPNHLVCKYLFFPIISSFDF
jgi:hypothetical protein